MSSRTGTEAAHAQGLEIEALAKHLGVNYILEGSVQESEGKIRVTLQLVRARDGGQVFSQVYERSLADGFRTQDEVASNVAERSRNKMAVDLRRQFPQYFSSLKDVDPLAVSLFLDSVDVYDDWLLGEGGDPLVAFELVQEAALIDPDFEAAQADVAWNLLFRIDPEIGPSEAAVRAHAAVDRILARDPESLLALQMKLQTFIQLDLDYEAAIEIIDAAIARSPRTAWMRVFRAEIALRTGQGPDPMQLLDMEYSYGLGMNGMKSEFLPIYATALRQSGRYETALAVTEEALELIHTGPGRAAMLHNKAEILLATGKIEEAEAVFEHAWAEGNTRVPELFAASFARLGQQARARDILDWARMTASNRAHFAHGYEVLGEPDRMFAILREGIEDRDRSVLLNMRTDFWSTETRSDPRFTELLDLLSSIEQTAKHSPPAA